MDNEIQNKNDSEGGSLASVWNESAVSYDAYRQYDPVYLACIEQTTKCIPKGTGLCLDAGCGTGLVTAPISSLCDKVVAVDYSQESLNILNKKKIKNVRTVQADLKCLPFEDCCFDVAICANTLQHLRPNGPQKQAIEELRRVTKRNGIICVSVHQFSRGKRKAGWIKEGKPGQAGIDYIYRFTRDDLLALMPQAEIRAVGYYGLLKIPFLGSKLQNPLATIGGGLASIAGLGHMLVAFEINQK